MIWLLGQRGFLFKSPIFLLIREFVGPLRTLLSGNRVALIQSKFRGTRATSKSLADLHCTYPKNNWLPLEKILQVVLCLVRERHWPRPAQVDGWISSLKTHSRVPRCRWSSQALLPSRAVCSHNTWEAWAAQKDQVKGLVSLIPRSS